MTTQLVKLLNYMVENRTNPKAPRLTNGYARSRFGVQNLTARIRELRERDFDIITDFTTIRNRTVASYRLGYRSYAEARNFISTRRTDSTTAIAASRR